MDAQVIVGKYYMVPCVRLRSQTMPGYTHPAAGRDGWVPVIGPEHHDRETLKFKPMHIHVDVRFIAERAVRFAAWGAGTWRTAEQAAMTLPVSTYSDGVGDTPLPFERKTRRMKCLRVMPDLPCAKHSAPWRAFEADYSACKLKPGNICPHRGIDLTPFIKADGTVICPGHGLRWDTKTGDLLPHHGVPA